MNDARPPARRARRHLASFGLVVTAVSACVAGRDADVDRLSARARGSGVCAAEAADAAGAPGQTDVFSSELVLELSGDDPIRRAAMAVGKLLATYEDGSVGCCTASIIASNLVLTADHCVRRAEGEDLAALTLTMGLDTAGTSADAVTYHLKPRPVGRDPTLDYLLLESFEDLASRWGSLPLSVREPTPGLSLALIHHPHGSAKRVSRRDCIVHRAEAKVGLDLLHHCESFVGSSGGPLLVADTDELVAMHRAGEAGDRITRTEYGTLIADIAAVDRTVDSLVVADDERSGDCSVRTDRRFFDIAIAVRTEALLERYLRHSADGSVCGRFADRARSRLTRLRELEDRSIGPPGLP